MKISVITVTYNCAEVVADCLASIANQKYASVEHILIDGGSTDNTLVELRANRDQFAVLVSEPDGGIYDAMNKGITYSNGDVIGFLNADDFYAHGGVLASVAQCFEEDPGLDACYADLIYVEKFNTARTVRYWRSNIFTPGSFSHGWCPPHPTFFVRRSVYERFGVFDLSYKLASDAEIMMRFLEVHKIRVKYVPDLWVRMRLGGATNKSFGNVFLQNKEILRALKNHGLPSNYLVFCVCKFFSRVKQFVTKTCT